MTATPLQFQQSQIAAREFVRDHPVKAIEMATRFVKDSDDFYSSVFHDLDVHTLIAQRITKSTKPITMEVRREYKTFTFYIRYGAFSKVPPKILKKYETLFPRLVALGKEAAETREARKREMKARFAQKFGSVK